MDLFGFNRFHRPPREDAPPKTGPVRWLQAFWDNLGALLGANLLCFAGFLPLAMGVSLGVVYENLWLTLLAGALGGAVAGPFWTALLSLALQSLRGGTLGWPGRWRQAFCRSLAPAALQGAFFGVPAAGLLLAGSFFGGLTGGADRPALAVWAVLAADLFVLALGAAALFPGLCVEGRGLRRRLRGALAILARAPGRTLGAAAALLAWCALGAALFPVSVPFALVVGFWPIALVEAQTLLPPLAAVYDLAGVSWEPDSPRPLTPGQRGEIWWRRHWPAVAAAVVCASLALGAANTLLTAKEPDLQIAIVHRDARPDAVRDALETSLAALVGDRNGDGAAEVRINDYTVVFDGTAENPDLQTAGSALLVTDIAAGDSLLYAVEDLEGFLALYADKVDGAAARLWGDAPVLAGLDAGTYSTVEDIYADRSGQSLLTSLTLLPGLGREADLLEALLP